MTPRRPLKQRILSPQAARVEIEGTVKYTTYIYICYTHTNHRQIRNAFGRLDDR
jgi:hypothetical protein